MMQAERSPQNAAEAGRLTARCGRMADSKLFQGFIYAVIIANAIVVGLSTYPTIDQDASDFLDLINEVFLGIFTVELAIRIGAYGRRPQDFFRDGWNSFDFVVVGLAFVPWLRKSATLLRLVRLLRVLRLASVRDDLRAVAVGMARSIPAIASLLVMVTLVVYFYAMIGWLMFHAEDPQHWGTVGQSMLTLFTVSTLEGWNVILYEGQQIQPGAWIFFVSFVLLISFLVINIVMGILMNSIENARERDLDEGGEEQGPRVEIENRLRDVRRALAELEVERAREEGAAGEGAVRERTLLDERIETLHRSLLALETELALEARESELEADSRPMAHGRGARPL
jgi:voltage-gated sodium channel